MARQNRCEPTLSDGLLRLWVPVPVLVWTTRWKPEEATVRARGMATEPLPHSRPVGTAGTVVSRLHLSVRISEQAVLTRLAPSGCTDSESSTRARAKRARCGK